MKKFKFVFILVLLLGLFITLACGEEEEKTFTVSFETGTQEVIESQTVKENGVAVKPADPTQEGYDFAGWYLEDAEYDFATAVVKDIVLVAKWDKLVLQKTISEIIAAEDGAYKAEGTVVGVNAQSFLLKDETGIILVYLGTDYAKDLVLGDKVKVEGNTSAYGLAKQFGKGTTYEKVEAGTASHGSAKELSLSQINAYATATSVTPLYVRLVGTVEVSGKFVNLNIEGADITGSLTYAVDTEALNALNGKAVEVYGYITGVTGSTTKYLNILFTEVNALLVESINVSFNFVDLNIGDEEQLTVTVFPEEASSEIEWVITPADCATISEDNVLKALKGGLVTVCAKAKDGSGVTKEFFFRIYNDVEDFTIIGKNEMYTGKSQELKIEVLTSDTNSDFVWSSNNEEIAVVDQNGIVTAVGDGTVIITAVANDSAHVSKTFEILVTTIDLSVKIGDVKYNTLEEALEAAVDGDVIVLPEGEITSKITITKSNITLAGPNAGVNPAKVNRKSEAILANSITIAAGVTGVVIDGFEFMGSGAVNLEAEASDITVQYCVFTKTSQDGVVRGPADGEVRNIKMLYNYSNAFSSYRFAHFAATINGLELIGNNITCTTAYDFLNVGGMLKGTVVIADNTYSNSLQSFLYVKGVGVADIAIYGNTMSKIANTFIDIRDMKEDGAVKVAIYYNEFKESSIGWMPIRIRTSGYDANDTIEVKVYDNKFIEAFAPDTDGNYYIENPSYSSQSDPFKAIYTVGKNYFVENGQVVTDVNNKHFCNAAISFETPYTSVSEVPGFDNDDDIYPTSITITNKIQYLQAFSTYEVGFTILPDNATNLKVGFLSSDTDVATISSAGLITTKTAGTCVITVYSMADPNVKDTFTLEVKAKDRIELRYEGTGVLSIGDELQLDAKHYSFDPSNEKIIFSSSDETIAKIDENGLITAITKGYVTITAKVAGLEATVSFTIVESVEELDELLQLLVNGNNGVVLKQNVMYIGSDDGSGDFENLVYGSVNDYFAGKAPDVIKNMLSTTAENYDGREMKSIEFIVFHDTAGAPSGSTAKANSGWCNNPTNTGSSWHYTIGNDGIYQQIEDHIFAWHAGDGIGWSEANGYTTVLHDTGIAADPDLRNRATATLGADGYFYINGQKTLVPMPKGATVATGTNTLGVACVVKNGTYHIPTTWITDGYGQVVAIRGGNINGIGIESCVNNGSDVWLTWQYSAKHIAQLLVKYDMTPERVLFHNNFSNKPCPRTMMTADLVEEFLDLVYLEYYVAKNYSDYTITFTSHNPNILDNTGRIVNRPEFTTNVSYTITVTKGGESQSITLNALVQGLYN